MSRSLTASRCVGALAAAGLVGAVAAPSAVATDEGDFVIVQPDWSAARIWNEATLEAIRKDFPNPPIHARNLFHGAALMYSVWAAFDDTAQPYIGNEVASADDVADARAEAISFAMYRLLTWRFANSPQADLTMPMLDDVWAQADELFEFEFDKEFTDTNGPSPAALGNRLAEIIINYGFDDGANELNGYADYTGYLPVNDPMVFDLPGCGVLCEDAGPFEPCFEDANRWQPLAFEFLVLQNGIVIGAAVQDIVGPWGGFVKPFALAPDSFNPETGVYADYDPGPPPLLSGEGDALYREYTVEVIERSRDLDPTMGPGAELIDIGPFSNHNNSLGADDGEGYGINPFTGQPYEEVVVPRADYVRCLAEFWADGPASETPPGHWHVIGNDVTDQLEDAGTPLVIGGAEADPVDRLEWDVKLYFGLGGAVHDAAIAAWGAKRFYDYGRPISAIRYMAQRGQSSDPDAPNYHPEGLPLIPGFIEQIMPEDILPGGKFENIPEEICPGEPLPCYIDDHVHDVAIYCWQGHPEDQENDIGGLGWIAAENWLPYQLTTFVTPAFPGYISGHSTFSRAAADFLTGFTGSPWFPGGLGTYTFEANEYLVFENGPSVDVTLTWAQYKDAADEAGISRRYGGIHPIADDWPARIIGAEIGQLAWDVAQLYYDGSIAAACQADLEADGVVDSRDLNRLLAAWADADPIADLDGDGDNDAVDLNLFLGAFGETCKKNLP